MQQNITWEKIGDFRVSNISLGKGTSCEVFYAVKESTMQKIAAKRINIKEITEKFSKQLENQIKNLKQLSSPFIVKLHGYLRYQNQNEKQSYLYIFLEFCEDIDLKKYLDQIKKKGKTGLPEAQALVFLRHIIEGYKQLQQKKIIHRDIKPANILLKQGIAKLSDFGFSRVVADTQVPGKFTLLGTPLYTAPQILRFQQFSSKCDVWSVGVVLYEMLYGKTPWNGKDLNDLRANIEKKPLELGDLHRHPQLKQLLQKMLKTKESQRISWAQIIAHPLFSSEIVNPKNVEVVTYEEFKKIYLEYVKNNIVKLFNIRTDVNIKQLSFQDQSTDIPFPENTARQKKMKEISRTITNKRNLAFLYAYILFLYYKNINLMSKNVNSGMELEYALANKALSNITELGNHYVNNYPTEYSKEDWGKFRTTSDFIEISKTIGADYQLLSKLVNQIAGQASKRFKNGLIKVQHATLLKNIDKEGTFNIIVQNNQQQLTKISKTGVCGLIKYHLDFALNPDNLDTDIDIGAYYQKKQRQYDLE